MYLIIEYLGFCYYCGSVVIEVQVLGRYMISRYLEPENRDIQGPVAETETWRSVPHKSI